MRWNPLRWLRWIGTGLVSMATPLPWLVDVTPKRFDDLERRVSYLESERCFLTETAVQYHTPIRTYFVGAMATWTR